ncbi:hypothetical protein MSG28_012390 [Choristoneura fumiferana]|uniref:Uncharacterized protein n=1 Tax=Choristoneura fumiferana TaxID=7141 RepID=A0ACC0KD08_CHOFU|nr:hypothetical protein MSG28_012390 [Choristoneura fumiferana]
MDQWTVVPAEKEICCARQWEREAWGGAMELNQGGSDALRYRYSTALRYLYMCVRIWLEVGHACEPRLLPLGRAPALDWRVWVRGVAGANISTFVQKVVFHLHPEILFTYPKRVLREPPYEIEESGSASIEIPIDVYLKFSTKPRRIHLKRTAAASSCYLTVEKTALIATTNPQKKKKQVYIEPIQNKPVYEKTMLFDECSKCDESRLDFTSSLRGVSMTEDEIKHVSQLYLSYSSYEKSDDALPLPPLSDPIYCIPELPASLRHALSSVEVDYVLQ